MQNWLRLRIVLLGMLFLTTQCQAGGTPEYGKKVRFKKGVELHFADFRLIYVGQRKVASPLFKPGFVFEDFDAVNKAGKTRVSWSAGTGSIDPVWFEIGGKAYSMELRHADGLGWLKNDELVIRRR